MNQEIHFVSGKGGVGKSTIAAALALKLAQEGKKTVLIELGEQSYFETYFKLKTKVGFEPVSIAKNLDLALFTGTYCLKEYALSLLKVESLYRLFFENPISKTLIHVAPALKELAILGKITSYIRQHGPPLAYEAVVIDAFATGHFITLVSAQAAMAKAVSFGPMGEQSRGIDAVLRDEKICKYLLVTLPEELPIKETEELKSEIQKHLAVQPMVILNKAFSPLFTKKIETEDDNLFYDFIKAKLKEETSFKWPAVPYVFQSEPMQVLETIVPYLKKAGL